MSTVLDRDIIYVTWYPYFPPEKKGGNDIVLGYFGDLMSNFVLPLSHKRKAWRLINETGFLPPLTHFPTQKQTKQSTTFIVYSSKNTLKLKQTIKQQNIYCMFWGTSSSPSIKCITNYASFK